MWQWAWRLRTVAFICDLHRGSIIKEIFLVGSFGFVRAAAMSLTSGFLNNVLRTLGEEIPIAAFGVIFRIVSFVIMPMMGIAMGAQPILGFNFGAKQFDRVKACLRIATLSATTIAFAGCLLFILFPGTVFRIFTDDPKLIAMGQSALRIMGIGIPLIGYQVIGATLFQALGKAGSALSPPP